MVRGCEPLRFRQDHKEIGQEDPKRLHATTIPCLEGIPEAFRNKYFTCCSVKESQRLALKLGKYEEQG